MKKPYKMYRGSYGRLNPIMVVGETEKFVILADGARREARDSAHHHIRATRNEVFNAFLDDKGTELEMAHRKVRDIESEIHLLKVKRCATGEGDA